MTTEVGPPTQNGSGPPLPFYAPSRPSPCPRPDRISPSGSVLPVRCGPSARTRAEWATSATEVGTTQSCARPHAGGHRHCAAPAHRVGRGAGSGRRGARPGRSPTPRPTSSRRCRSTRRSSASPPRPIRKPSGARRCSTSPLAALVHGDLDVSERAFTEAAACAGRSGAGDGGHLVRRAGAPVARCSGCSAALRAPDVPRRAPRPAPPPRRRGRTGPPSWASPACSASRSTAGPCRSALGMDSRIAPPHPRRVHADERGLLPAAPTCSRATVRSRAGQANLVLYGGTRGIWHGVMAGALLGGQPHDTTGARAWATSMLLGSAAELTGGYLLAGRTGMTAGHARTMAALGDFGLLWGVGAGYLLRFPERSTTSTSRRAGWRPRRWSARRWG